MPSARVRLECRLPEEFVGEFERRVFFISDAICDFELVRRGGAVEAIDLALSTPELSDDSLGDVVRTLEEKISRVVHEEILVQKTVPPRVVWRSPAAGRSCTDAFPLLEDRGIAFAAGEGQVGYGEPLISLVDYLDGRLRDIALSFESSREYRYPTLLPTHVLDRIGYFASFPQFVMFVTWLHNDVDVYDAFLAEYAGGQEITPGLFAHCRSHDCCLPPTMCYHSYHQYRGRRLDGDQVVTARGKAFRFESKYHAGMSRLWDFTIRETVFMGTEAFAAASRMAFMHQGFALMEELGLAGTCEVANDLFFANRDTAGKIFSQRLMELKYELLLEVGAGRPIAVGSFNMHGPFFGEAFGITRGEGEPVTTACVGFGLERLAYAFLCQHGVDEAGWPEVVRRAIG